MRQEVMASEPFSPRKGGVVSVSVSVKEVWPIYLSV